jgi:hypothetical protein
VLGKARIYAWSDRKSQAVKAYAQAVELSDDAEAEHELAELRAGLTVGGDASAGYTSDSDGYRASTFGSTGSFDIDFQTRAIASLDFARVGTNRGPLAATPGIPTDNSGLVGYAGLERDLPHDIEVSAEIGYRWWDRAPGHLLARGSIETYLASDTALGLSVAYGDFLPFSDSYAVVLSGIDSTNLRAHVWQGLPLRHSLFAYVDTAFVSDDNRRIGAGGSYEYQPLASVDLAIGISLEFLTCTERSLLYYDPELDLGGEAFLRLTQPVLSWLGLRLETAVGAGYAREVGLSGSGLTYLVSGGLDLRWRRLTLGLTASRHQSQRATTYTSQSFGASLNLEF